MPGGGIGGQRSQQCPSLTSWLPRPSALRLDCRCGSFVWRPKDEERRGEARRAAGRAAGIEKPKAPSQKTDLGRGGDSVVPPPGIGACRDEHDDRRSGPGSSACLFDPSRKRRVWRVAPNRCRAPILDERVVRDGEVALTKCALGRGCGVYVEGPELLGALSEELGRGPPLVRPGAESASPTLTVGLLTAGCGAEPARPALC